MTSIRRSVLIVTVALVAMQSLQAQSPSRIDSLLTALMSAKVDSVELFLEMELAEEYLLSNASLSLEHGRKAVVLAYELEEMWLVPYVYNVIGLSLDDLGRYGEAVEAYEKAIALTEIQMQESPEFAKEYQEDLVIFLNNAGYSEFNRGSLSTAMEFYLRSLETAEACQSESISAIFGSIAELYLNAEDLANAKRYGRMAFAVAVDSASRYNDASVLGDIMIGEGKADSAIQFFTTLLSVDNPLLTTYDSLIAYSGIAKGYILKGAFDEAESLLSSAFLMSTVLDNKILQARLHADKSILYVAKGQVADGMKELDAAIQVASSSGSFLLLPEYYERRSELRKASGDVQGAYRDISVAVDIKDSLRRAFNTDYLSRLMSAREALLRQDRSAQMMEELSIGQTRARNSMRFGITMLMMTLVVAMLAYLAIRRRAGVSVSYAPVSIARSSEVQIQFLKRISSTLLMLLIPLAVYYGIWREFHSLVLVGIGAVVSIAVYLLARAGRLRLAAALMIITAYPLVVILPESNGGINMSVLWIPATFIILSFTINDFRFQVINGVLATVAFLGYLWRIAQSGEAPAQGIEAQLIIGLMAICAIFVALYYQRGRLFDYKFGLDTTTSFLRLIADSNPNFVFAKDVDRRYTFANKAMVDTYKLQLDEIIGRTPEEINPAFEESDHFRQDDIEVLTKGVSKEIDEERVYAHDGTSKWLSTIKKPILNDKNEVVGLIGVATDITESRRSAHELRHSLSLLEATIDSSTDAILVVNLAGEIVLYNDPLMNLWGERIMSSDNPGDFRLKVAASQTKDPEQFLKRVKEINQDRELEAADILEMANGKIYERLTRPQRIDDEVVGRIWTFRDITERETALRDLRRSEERYRTSLEDNLFSILRVSHGRLISVNKAFEALTGYTHDELLNTIGLDKLVHPEDQLAFADFSESIISGQLTSGNLSCRVLTKDGEVKFVLASIKGYYDDSGRYIESTITAADVTLLKEVEGALAESETRYRSLVEASPDGILMADRNGIITFASPRLLEMAKATKDTAPIGRHLMDFALNEEQDRAKLDLARAMSSGSPVFGRYRIAIGKDQTLDVELGGRMIQDSTEETLGVIVVVRDIEEQARAERVLRGSEERYRALFENTFDGFVIIDRNGQIDQINQSAIELLKYSAGSKLKGHSIDSLFPGLSSQEMYSDVLKGIADRSTQMRFEGRDFYGSPIFVEVNLCSVQIDGERLVACAIKDVAERVVLENKEKELQNQEMELDALNRELVSHSIFNSQKSKLLTEIMSDIKEAGSNAPVKVQRSLEKTARKIESNLNDQEDMDAFRIQFERIHPNFFKRLTASCPSLTSHDLKYCAYIRLNMSTQDISNLLYIERKSVEMSKYRIKKKLGLDKGERLAEYLHSV